MARGNNLKKKFTVSEADKKLFREAMRHVTPLSLSSPRPKERGSQSWKTRTIPRTSRKDEITEEIIFSDHETLEEVSGEELLEFKRPGIQDKIIRNLRRGQYNVQAILDLHGKNVEEARVAVTDFLIECQKNNIRCGLIIHGKGHISGKAILKNKLNHWLRQTNNVLAFCSATRRQGRGGALYVLLRVKR